MTKALLLSLVTFCLLATFTEVVHANELANPLTEQPLFVSLWHTWVNDAGTTVFWDSNVAPILEDSPEFLHTRLAAPTGAAYEIDVTATTMSLKASDLSGVSLTEIPAGQADRYYLFIDATLKLSSATLAQTAPSGVSVQIIPKGTEFVAQDKSYPMDLDLQLDQEAVLIELGPGTTLQDDSLEIVVNYVRVPEPITPKESAQVLTGQASAASFAFVSMASLVGTLCLAFVL